MTALPDLRLKDMAHAKAVIRELYEDRTKLVAELKRLCSEIPRQLGSNKPMTNDLLRSLGEE